MGLRSRLLLLVSLAALPALILAFIANLDQRKQGTAKVQRDSIKLVQLAAAKQLGLIDATRQHLSGFARLPPARGNDIPAFDGFFKGVLKIYTNYTDFGLIETNGQLVSSAFARRGPTNLAERADLTRVLATERFAIGDLQPRNERMGPALLFGHPVLDEKSRVVRVLYAALDADVINASLRQVPLPDGAVLRVFDRSGVVVAAHPDVEKWIGKSASGSELWSALATKEEGTAQVSGLDGMQRLYAFTTIREANEPSLRVAVGIPIASAFAETDHVLRMNLIVLGVVAICIWSIAWLYANHYILRPVSLLMKTTREVTAGNFTARTGLRSGSGELHQLAQELDGMAAILQAHRAETERSQKELRQSESQVRELNAELEDRVQKRTAQLEQAYQELEAFSYSVSHDLRAPLRPIHGYVEVLQQEYGPALGPEPQRLLNNISKAAKRMGTLIDNLLAFSRMGRAELRHGPVQMSQLVQEVLRELQPDLAGRNIQWQVDSLPEVVGDRAMLKQVWVNLLSNAIKYSSMRDPAEIGVGCRPTASEFEFYVRDNGAGFDMKYAHKLFGVFQRLHQVDEFEGTGIGLANVHRIIVRHGGRTWAEGQIDAGATFHFSLPRLPS